MLYYKTWRPQKLNSLYLNQVLLLMIICLILGHKPDSFYSYTFVYWLFLPFVQVASLKPHLTVIDFALYFITYLGMLHAVAEHKCIVYWNGHTCSQAGPGSVMLVVLNITSTRYYYYYVRYIYTYIDIPVTVSPTLLPCCQQFQKSLNLHKKKDWQQY